MPIEGIYREDSLKLGRTGNEEIGKGANIPGISIRNDEEVVERRF